MPKSLKYPSEAIGAILRGFGMLVDKLHYEAPVIPLERLLYVVIFVQKK